MTVSTTTITTNTIPLEFCVVGKLRAELTLRSRESMIRSWKIVFPDEMLPADHESVDESKVIDFVTSMAKSVRGRPGSITTAAQSLIRRFNVAANIETSKQEPESISDVLEMVGKNDREQLEQFIDGEKVNGDTQKQPDVSEKVEPDVSKFTETSTRRSFNISDVFGNVVDWMFSLTKLDVVFGITIAFADYGLAVSLHEFGIGVGAVYTLISLNALDMAKNSHAQQTARNGLIAVWFLEMLAFAVHLSMFNLKLWNRVDQLPFNVDDASNDSRVFWIACVIAGLFSVAGIYSVSTTLSLTIEKVEAMNFEDKHGVKY